MFKSWQKKLQNISFSNQSMPWVLLAFLGLAFGLMIPWLGIYQDDWLFVYNAYALGPQGIYDFMFYDGTPLVSYQINALFALLGFNPITWHIFSLLCRWLTVIIFWLVLRQIWPQASRQTFFSAVLFALYPFFNLQPMALTYSHVWVAYFFLGLSFYWMILSIKNPEKYWMYTTLSILAGLVTIFSGEYFAGLELIRPVLIIFILQFEESSIKNKALKILKFWLPYLLIFAAYVYWRFFLYQVPIENRNTPTLIVELLNNPLAGLATIIFNLIPDVVLIVISSWYTLLEPSWLDFTIRINQFALVLVIFSSFFAYFYFSKQKEEKAAEQSLINWPIQAAILGLVIVVFGLIPPYVGGLFLNAKNPLWNSRFGMASMLGAALLIIALLETLINSLRARRLVLALLVGLSIGWHFRYTNDFRLAWEKQTELYRQLVVRMPSILPNTALMADHEVLSLMGDYPTAYALNTIYAQQGAEDAGRMKVWFYGISTNFNNKKEELLQGMPLFTRHRSMVFKGTSQDAIVFSYEPGLSQCLHVIRPADKTARMLNGDLRDASILSQPQRIKQAGGFNTFLTEALNIHPLQNWCNYYQQADLARQNGNWQQVAAVWQEAQQLGLQPNDGFEFLPFVEAYLRLEQPEDALKVALLVKQYQPSTRQTVCDLWATVLSESQSSSSFEDAFQTLKTELACLK